MMKWSTCGLFSDEGESVDLAKISREIDKHPGNVWGLIFSLKREDAERLGYNCAEQWMHLLRARRNDIAKEMHISPENHRFQLILKRANCKKVRFHDLRHTFATMALENGMDIKTLSAMIGHESAETTLNIYSHITDTMRKQAAARIDREIAGADTPIPEPEADSKSSEQPPTDQPTEPKFEPYKPVGDKIRKPGTGCVTMINDHLYVGRFSPRVNGKRISKNIYAATREECEEKLKVLIAEMKKEIEEIRANARNEGQFT